MGIGKNYVTSHAIDRIRERWPSAKNAPLKSILTRVAACIERAKTAGELVRLPGGTYVPFSYEGDEGFLVLKKRTVTTAMGTQWCPEVTTYLENRRNERHQ